MSSITRARDTALDHMLDAAFKGDPCEAMHVAAALLTWDEEHSTECTKSWRTDLVCEITDAIQKYEEYKMVLSRVISKVRAAKGVA